MIQLYQTLDLRPIGIPQTLRLSQYDSDFEIIFELTNFDGTWILDTNTTAEVQGTKTDGHGYSADAVFDDQLKTVTIAGDVQMTAAAGRNVYEVVLFHDGDRLGSKNFILDVERAALDAETTQSDSKIKNFTEMTEAATQAAATATEAAEAAEEAASTFSTDTTLSIAGKAADAEAVGEAIDAIEPGLSDAAKEALLTCFQYVAWINDQGQTYYDALEAALYAGERTLVSISAVFEQGSTVFHVYDTLEDLIPYLTVTATYSDETTETVTDYELYGSLATATSTITVSYQRKTTTFDVSVTIDASLIYYAPKGHVLDGTNATAIDTGIKLADTDKTFTILFDATDEEILTRVRNLVLVSGSQIINNYNTGETIQFTSAQSGDTYTKQYSGIYGSAASVKTQNYANSVHRIQGALVHTSGANAYKFTIYVDGNAEQENTSQPSEYSSNDLNTFIGSKPTGGYNWKGTINLLNIYNRALGLTEIKSLLGVS